MEEEEEEEARAGETAVASEVKKMWGTATESSRSGSWVICVKGVFFIFLKTFKCPLSKNFNK